MAKVVIAGDCSDCGACCRVVAMPIRQRTARRLIRTKPTGEVTLPLAHADNKPWTYFLKTHGAEVGRLRVTFKLRDTPRPVRVGSYGPQGALVAYLSVDCPEQDGWRCKLFGTPERPEVCGKWPQPADDLHIVEGVCTYKIVDEPEEDADGHDRDQPAAAAATAPASG